MKTRILITLSFLLLGYAATFANPNEVKKEAEEESHSEAWKLLERRVFYPNFAKQGNISGTVVFDLKLREDNRIEYMPVEYENYELSNELEHQVRRLEKRLAKVMEPGKTRRFKVNFVLK